MGNRISAGTSGQVVVQKHGNIPSLSGVVERLMVMYQETKRVREILETYGLERILEDNDITIEQVVTLLEDLGYLYLEMYEEEE